MKYELDKSEFKTMHQTALKMMEMMCQIAKLAIANNHEIALKRLELDTRKQEFAEAKANMMRVKKVDPDEDKGWFSDEEESEDTPQPSVLQFHTVEQPEEVKEEVIEFTTFAEPASIATDPEAHLTDHQSYGKIYLVEMLQFWLQNFQKEGEQPNRSGYLEELVRDGRKAGAIVSYAMVMNGLTRAVWNALWHAVHVLEEDSLSEWLTFEKVRYIAGNLCQVSSIHLAPLADEFEYPNPFMYMEEK